MNDGTQSKEPNHDDVLAQIYILLLIKVIEQGTQEDETLTIIEQTSSVQKIQNQQISNSCEINKNVQ